MKKKILFFVLALVVAPYLQAGPPIYEFTKCCRGLFGYNYVNKELTDAEENRWMITCEGRGFIQCKPNLLSGPDDNNGVIESMIHKIMVEERIYKILDEVDGEVINGKHKGTKTEKLVLEDQDGKKKIVVILTNWEYNEETDQLYTKVQLKKGNASIF